MTRRAAVLCAVGVCVGTALGPRAMAEETGIGLPLRAVQFESDAWVDERGLRALLPLAPGAPVTAQDLAEARRVLELTEVFRAVDVAARAEDGEAVVLVRLTRKRIITDVSVTGYDALRWRDVYRLLRLRSGAFYDPAVVAAAEERLRTRYRQLGYPDAQVRHRLRRRPGEVDIVFTIDEGEPTQIAAVVVTGTTGLPPRELEHQLRRFVGKPHDRNAARDGERMLLRALRRAGYYDVQIDSDWTPTAAHAGVLWFTVAVGPLTEVEIIGNEALSDKRLLGLMDLETRLIVTDGTWRELARRMTRAYRDAGYYRARIRVRIEDGPPRRIVFRVDEGRRYAVRRVRFEGNEAIPADRLRDEMNTQPGRWLPWPRRGAFVREVFDEDLRRLWFFYREQAFADAEIVDAPIEVDEATGTIDVTVVIVEGPRTIVEAVHVPELPPSVEPPPRFALVPGQPLLPAQLETDTDAIERAFRAAGYVDVAVKPAVTRRPEADRAPAVVDWQVSQGPRHVIGSVIVQGNVETTNDTILRELPFAAGDPLDPESLRRGQDRVFQLGTYRSVSVEPIEPNGDRPVMDESDGAPPQEPGERVAADPVVQDVGVAVVPRPPGNLQWGGGYNTRDGITGFAEVTYDNIGNRARRLTVRGQGSVLPNDPSSTQFLALIGYRQPRIFGSEWQWNSELVGERSTRTIDQYDILRGSFGNGVVRDLLPRLKLGVELQVEYADTFNVRPVPFRAEDSGVSYTTALSPSLTFDGRNDPFAPTSGVFDTVRLRYAPPGLSTVQFGKINLQHSQAFPLARWLSFIYSTRIGYGGAFSGATVLPIRERYFLGGLTTVRGFSENSIGPRDVNNTVIGGDLAMVLSVELRVPIIYQLSAAAFNDNGGLFLTQCGTECRQQRDVRDNAFTFSNFRHSAGPGLRYMTPVGPIGLDYGFKLDRRAGESIGEIHFSISGTF